MFFGQNKLRRGLIMPIDFDASGPLPRMPVGHEILIPGAKQFRVRSTGGGAVAPDLRKPYFKQGIDDLGDAIAEVIAQEKRRRT